MTPLLGLRALGAEGVVLRGVLQSTHSLHYSLHTVYTTVYTTVYIPKTMANISKSVEK